MRRRFTHLSANRRTRFSRLMYKLLMDANLSVIFACYMDCTVEQADHCKLTERYQLVRSLQSFPAYWWMVHWLRIQTHILLPDPGRNLRPSKTIRPFEQISKRSQETLE